jgi:spermidine synthase
VSLILLAIGPDVPQVVLLGVGLLGPPAMLAAGLRSRRHATGAAALAILAFAMVRVAWSQGRFAAPCDLESDYYCIKVRETIADGRPARMLVLDRLVHSYIVPDDPSALGYGYEQAYANLTEAHATGRAQIDTLFIGGGGYSFPRYIEAVYPRSSVDVIEIDPAVIAVAHERLALPTTTRIRSFNEDARVFLTAWTDPKTYDLIYGDAFNDLSIPYHLTTVEFNRIVADRLKPDGIYLTNVIDRFEGGEFLKAQANALRAVFPHVYVFGRGEAFLPFDRNTYVVMASRQPLDREKLDAIASRDDPSSRTTLLPEPRLKEYLASGRALTLTDDFVPVDQLLANLFVERGN